MKTHTRLLLFVLLPPVLAAGVVVWTSWRQTPTPSAARRALPATTQVVAGRAATAWTVLDLSYSGYRPNWGAFGFLDRDTWYGASVRQYTPRAGPATPASAYARFDYQLAAGDAKGGRMHTASGFKETITGPGVESAGLLYVPTDASTVTAIDLMTQRPIWTAEVGGPTARLAVAANRLVACADDRITCLDPISGRTVWSTRASDDITTDAGLTDRFACYATADALHVLDAATGRELRTMPGTGLAGHIAMQGDRAYVCGHPRGTERAVVLHAFGLDRGALVWTWTEAATLLIHPPKWVDVRGPAAGDGAVVFTMEDRLCAVDAATGRRRWLWINEVPGRLRDRLLMESLEPGQLLGAPAIHAGVVYASWWGTRVSGWDVATGREVWRYEGRADQRLRAPSNVPPVARDGLLLCATAGEGLCALRCDLIPKAPPPPPTLTPAAKPINLPWAVGAASTLLLVGIILAVFGLWRFMISLACLLLSGVTIWAWLRSYPAAEFVGQQQTLTNTRPFVVQSRRGVLSRDGTLTFGQTHDVWQSTIRRPLGGGGKPSSLWWTREPVAREADDNPARNLLRFAWTHRSRPSGTPFGIQAETSLTLPHWLVAALLAIAPLAWLSGAWRDRRRYAKGLCPWCGYDLRESKGRCPECGRAIPTARKA